MYFIPTQANVIICPSEIIRGRGDRTSKLMQHAYDILQLSYPQGSSFSFVICGLCPIVFHIFSGYVKFDF